MFVWLSQIRKQVDTVTNVFKSRYGQNRSGSAKMVYFTVQLNFKIKG